VDNQTYSTPAPVTFAVPRGHVSMWAEPVQGIRMPVPALQVRGISLSGTTCASANAATNAAKGATRKDATGGGAFEDPV
jgi:hypothetical protein